MSQIFANGPYPGNFQSQNSWLNGNLLTKIMGFSFIASLFGGLAGGPVDGLGGVGAAGGKVPYLWNSIGLLVLGVLFEAGRRSGEWIFTRVRFQYSISAQFTDGDPAYEWIILFLTDAQIWKASREFHVTTNSSVRKWSVKPDNTQSVSGSTLSSLLSLDSLRMLWNSLPLVSDVSVRALRHLEAKGENLQRDKDGHNGPHVEFVPTYETPQLFRWKGYWVEIKRNSMGQMMYPGPPQVSMNLTIYTHDLNVLSVFVEETRQGYIKTNRPHVIVHLPSQHPSAPMIGWASAKAKPRRPLSSIILQEGVINSLVSDVKEFLETEEWYLKAGIPYRRGYLLYGPPGTGKTSTIYAVAGELGLEVYSLSLSGTMMDDNFLQKYISLVPKNSIILIEDIDCAFPAPRDDDAEDKQENHPPMYGMNPMYGNGNKTGVTLSGLLNVLDGIGGDEGKIFFATTNHIDRLDAAMLRPGRVDRKFQYQLATQAQAEALFLRFYPESTLEAAKSTVAEESISEKELSQDNAPLLQTLASQFRNGIPPNQFSTAELQGYLLGCKNSPHEAVAGVAAWVESEISERLEKKRREEEKKAKAAERKAAKAAGHSMGSPFPFPGFQADMGLSPLPGMQAKGPMTNDGPFIRVPGFPPMAHPPPMMMPPPPPSGLDLVEDVATTPNPTQKARINGIE